MKLKFLLFVLIVLFLSCDNSTEPEDVYGCTDPSSCNYDPNVTVYVPGSCLYIDECGGCGENVKLWGECYNIEGTTELDLSGYFDDIGELTGEIPVEIGNLTNLTYLNLRYNQLTGEIPSEIGNLMNLTYLDLYSNQLTGEIPSSIGNLINLTNLSLSHNQLTGEIPSSMGDLTNLIYLDLYINQLTGVIPSEICSQGDSTPVVGYNKLCPPYPSCISQIDMNSQDTSECGDSK